MEQFNTCRGNGPDSPEEIRYNDTTVQFGPIEAGRVTPPVFEFTLIDLSLSQVAEVPRAPEMFVLNRPIVVKFAK